MNYDINNNQNSNPSVVPNMTPNINTNPNVGVAGSSITNESQKISAIPSNVTVSTVQNQVNVIQSNSVNNVQNTNVINNATPVNNGNVSTNAVQSSIQDKFKVFMNGLFNFSNIKKLFRYDWSSIIEEILPKDTKEAIDKESYDNIFYGGVLKVVADILAIIFSICMVYVIDTLDPARISGLRTLGLNNDISITAFIPIIITLIIFTYNSAIGYQKQKTTFHFAFIWMIFISTIFSLVKLVSYVATLFISPLYALLGFISLFLSLLGNVHVIIGCIDFCKRVTKNYIVAHTVAPVQSAITTTRIDIDDVSDHNNKTCPYCANQNPTSATTCAVCGNNI